MPKFCSPPHRFDAPAGSEVRLRCKRRFGWFGVVIVGAVFGVAVDSRSSAQPPDGSRDDTQNASSGGSSDDSLSPSNSDDIVGLSEFVGARRMLVRDYVAGAGVTDRRVLDAILGTPRHRFVDRSLWSQAYYDMALPIGHSQTISSPFIVASMTAALDPQPGDRVLEIGTGSGYQAAVLSPLVADVYTIEIVEPLGRSAAEVLSRLGYQNVHTRIGDGFAGWPEAAPFDKIIVTCSPESVPKPLVEQLAEGGAMVIPVGQRYQQTLYRLIKRDGELVQQKLQPTLFVPMTGTAEEKRMMQPDGRNPKIINGDFEHDDSAAAANQIRSPLTNDPSATDVSATDPSATDAADTDGETFKTNVPEIRGWYYGRQVRVETDAETGQRFARCTNSVPGLFSHLLQGVALDGRHVNAIRLRGRCRVEDVQPGLLPDTAPMIALSFYDEDRKDLGVAKLGPLKGTRDWRAMEQIVRVPADTRHAIVRIGLFGATGTADFDDIELIDRGDD